MAVNARQAIGFRIRSPTGEYDMHVHGWYAYKADSGSREDPGIVPQVSPEYTPYLHEANATVILSSQVYVYYGWILHGPSCTIQGSSPA